MTSDGGTAFPVIPPIESDGNPPAGYPYPDCGMSLRDYVAVAAMTGYLSDCGSVAILKMKATNNGAEPEDYLASACYCMADAMLRERDRKPAEESEDDNE